MRTTIFYHLLFPLLAVSSLIQAQGGDCSLPPNTITIAAEVVDAECPENANGSITVNASNGQAPYRYSIDGGPSLPASTFTGLAPGEYAIAATDANGCSSTTMVTVGSVQIIIEVLEILPAGCDAGGMVTLSEIAARGYLLWRDEFNFLGVFFTATLEDLSAGSYTILQGSDDCQKSIEFVVPNNCDVPDLRLETNLFGCAGNSIIATVSNANGRTVEFSLDGGPFQSSGEFTIATVGSHTITARFVENGKETTRSIFIEQPGLTFSYDLGDFECASIPGSIRIDEVNGGSEPYTYQLDDGDFQEEGFFRGLLPGEYTITVRDDEECTRSETFTIRDASYSLEIVEITPAGCPGGDGGAVTFNETDRDVQYSLWIVNEKFVGSQSSPEFTGLAAGEYLVSAGFGDCFSELRFKIPTVCEERELLLSADPVLCFGDLTTLTARVTDADGEEVVYRLDDGSFQNENTFNVAGGRQYQVTARIVASETELTTSIFIDQPGPLAFDLSSSETGCSDPTGSISVENVTGGTGPYRYSIDGGGTYVASAEFGNLGAGSYRVAVIDANDCTSEQSVTVSQNGTEGDIDLAAVLVTIPTCGNRLGSVVARVGGDRSNLEFSIDGETFQSDSLFTDLIPADYVLTARKAGTPCVSTASITVPAPETFTLEVTTEPAGCPGDSEGRITVGASNGTSPFRYSIDAGTTFSDSSVFTGLSPGSYLVVVTSADRCEATAEVEVAATEAPFVLSALVTQPVSCADPRGSVRLSTAAAVGGSFEFRRGTGPYRADSTFADLAPGSYEFLARRVGGICTQSVAVTVEAAASDLALDSVEIDDAGCDGGGSVTVSATGGVAPYRFNWSTGSTGPSVENLAAGTYGVTVTDLNGCQLLDSFAVDQLAGEFPPFPDVSICAGATTEIAAPFAVRSIVWRTEDGLTLSVAETLVVAGEGVVVAEGTALNGCVFIDTFSVAESDRALRASFLVAGQAVAGQVVVLVENSYPVPEFLDWSFTGPAEPVSVLDSLNQYHYRFDRTGEYGITLAVEDAGCRSSLTKSIEIVGDSSLLDPDLMLFSEITSLSATPNPTSGPVSVGVRISTPRAVNLRVYDLTGALVERQTAPASAEHSFTLDLGAQLPGLYIVNITTGNESRNLVLVLQ